MRGGLVVDGRELCDLCAAVAELSTRATGFDDGHADAEGHDFLRDGLHEPFNAPLRGVIKRVPREGDLAAVGRDLNYASAALSAKVRQRGTDKVNRPDQIGCHEVFDLPVGEFLGRAEQAVTGVADDYVDPSMLRERAFDHCADRRRVSHFEHFSVE